MIDLITHRGFSASEAWQAYKEEAGLAKVQFATVSCNPEASHTWTVGTNLFGVLDQARHEAKEQPSRLFHNPCWLDVAGPIRVPGADPDGRGRAPFK